MRALLLAATLMAFGAVRVPAAEVSCAVLFRDVVVAPRTLQDLALDPARMMPAFDAHATPRKASSPAAAALVRWQLIHFDTPEARDAAVARLRAHPHVQAVEAVRRLRLELPPPSSSAAAPQEIPWNVDLVRAPAALAEVEADSTLIVAVIDTGVDLTHPDLRARLWDSGDAPGNASSADDDVDQNSNGIVETWELHDDDDNGYVDDRHGYDFVHAPGQGGSGDSEERDDDPDDDHGHGTHVTGIIAAHGSLEGVAPFVRLMPVRAAYATAFGGGVLQTNDAAAAIVYAVDNGARVLNLSWGDTVESLLIRAALDHAVASDVVVVAAAGNDGGSAVHWPAADPRVLAVGASTRQRTRSSFSNHGAGLDLLAPGEAAAFPGAGILSLEPRSRVPAGRGERRGTSMAAPHVAGVAAIVRSRADRPDAATTRALMLDSATRSGADWNAERGHGHVDALAAVRADAAVLALWHGPLPLFQQGRLRADATVWGAAVQGFEVVAEHTASGTRRNVLPWHNGFVWRQRVVDAPFDPMPAGGWQLVLRVEDTTGRVRERRQRFDVDTTPPAADSVSVAAAWRGARPRWLLAAGAAEPVSIRVLRDGIVVFGHEGLAARHLLETAADAALAGTWTILLRDAAAATVQLERASPAVLEAWPSAAAWPRTSTLPGFLPSPVQGTTPSGRTVIWGQYAVPAGQTVVQAAEVRNDSLHFVVELPARGRPVAYADIDGDGRSDLLVQNGLRAAWWTTCSTCEFPGTLRASVTTERVLGLFQLDADAALETLLSSRDSLLVFDDASAGPPQRRQVLVNPVQEGFAFWGADAAAGDLDGDGRIELVCGDGEGNVSVFEAVAGQSFSLQQVIDTHGSYAYDVTAVPPDGFVVGRQRTRSVTGDGFATAPYEFLLHRHDGFSFEVVATWPFLAPTGDLHAGSAFVPGSPDRLALVRGEDAYLLQRHGDTWLPEGWFDGAAGEAPAGGDLQGNGTTTLVVRSADGAAARVLQGQRGPHGLVGTSLAAGVLHLAWQPGDGTRFRVRRRLPGGDWEDRMETVSTTWVDSMAPVFVAFEVEVQALAAGQVQATSNRIHVGTRDRPRLQAAVVRGPRLVSCQFTHPMQVTTASARSFHLRGADRTYTIQSVSRSQQGRRVDLLLQEELPCDSLELEVTGLRDTWNGRLDPPSTLLGLIADCAAAPFLVSSITASRSGFEVGFSAPPAAEAFLASTYAVTWNGVQQAVEVVEAVSATAVLVRMQQPLVARGIPYRVGIDAQLRSSGGQALQAPGAPHEVLFAGAGTGELFVAPNPVRPGTHEVVFAEAAPDTRIEVYTLEGERVRRLDVAPGGAVRWDLRNGAGTRVAAGTYLWVATDAFGRAVGRLVVIR